MTTIAARFSLVGKRAYGTGSLYIKAGCWYGRWRTSGGRRHARKIGETRKLTKKQAEAKLREAMLAAPTSTARGRDSTTVAELGAALIATLEAAGRKPSHLESVRYHLAAHIDPLLGDLRVSHFVDDDVRRLVDRMTASGKAPKTIRNVAGTLHSVLALAVTERLIERNPCDMARLPAVHQSQDIRFLTAPELERVLAAPPRDEDDVTQAEVDWWPVLRLLVLTAAMTGMRLGELRALRWKDLDYGAMKVRVRQSYVRGQYGTPKTRKSVRAIPLASRLVTELDAHHRATVWNNESDLVLAHPHTGRPLDRVRLLQHFKAALRRADVRPVRIHDLRHTFATTVAASGDVSLRTLQEWMGHLDARTTQLYADYMPGEREQQQIDAAFGGQSVANPDNTPSPGTPQTPENIA